MDSTTLGITILDGSTRIRSNGQLIRLEDLASTPGPPGPPGEQGIQGIQGPAGQDGQDGTVDTTNYYNKAQVDFLLMMNTPSIGTYPGQGIRVWDDAQDLMRNLVGQNGVSVSLHGDGDRIIIDGSGISGLDPSYIVLANNLVTLNKNLVVNGGDDSQILFSTSDGATTPGASLINDPYQNHFLLQLNGSDRINVGPSLITLNGSVACGAMTLDSILNLTTTGLASHIQLNGSDRITLNQTNTTLHGDIFCGPLSASSATVGGEITASSAMVTNAVSCASLTTTDINMSMPGLSSNIMVNGAGRLSFTQLNTQILGDLEVTGNLTSANGGGGTVDLTPYQHHASSHIIAYGMENNAQSNTVSLHPIGNGWDAYLSWGTFTHVANNYDYHPYPNTLADDAWIEFYIPAGAKSCLAHMLYWTSGGFCDVQLIHANGTALWANRLNLYGAAESVTLPEGDVLSSRAVVVAAGHINGPWERIRFQGRRGTFNIISVAFQDHVLPQSNVFTHSENIIGDPASLSDGRLKTERTELSGQQAQSVLNQIKSYTYDRDDIGERRLGLIADEVESAVDQLAIDNVVSSKWHNDGQYKTLDYSRLVSLLIPAINTLAKRVEDLESKLNGNSS